MPATVNTSAVLHGVGPFSRKVESTRQRIDEWEQAQHEKLNLKVQKARDELDRTGQSAQEKLKP